MLTKDTSITDSSSVFVVGSFVLMVDVQNQESVSFTEKLEADHDDDTLKNVTLALTEITH